MEKWQFFWRRLRKQLWFRASLYGAVGIITALAAVLGAPFVPEAMAERLGGESVEAILTILASSLLAVATFSLGALVTAYTSVSGAISPRVASLVTGDEGSQRALATFIGVFLYAIVGVTAVNANYYGAEGRAIIFVVSLAVVALVAFRLLAWISRLSRLGRMGQILHQVESETRAAMEHRLKAPRLCGAEGQVEGGREVTSVHTGYVQNIDPNSLCSLARKGDFDVEILAMPGQFVFAGEPLARISRAEVDRRVIDKLAGAFTLGEARTFEQDPRFGLVVLSEISARALSAGVNDYGTAIEVIGVQARLINLWVSGRAKVRPEPPLERLYGPALSEADMIDDAFTATARDGAGDVAVATRLQKLLAALEAHVGREEVPGGTAAGAIAAMRRQALERAMAELSYEDDRARVRAAAAHASG
ncbi:MAG: DUF2254 domain-containing protein [Brevundimonas sp.]|uniref:DUF2254 domain-containing protein n=1 Tax=Brevundimonas sp. TaxID=1871086 RepID=UPI00391BF688